jgi:hypothetical protein
MGLEQVDIQSVLRAAGETETPQRLASAGWRRPWIWYSDRGEKIASVFFFIIFVSTICSIKFFIYFFSNVFFWLLGLSFASLIRIIG